MSEPTTIAESIQALTKAQRDTLDRIAISQPPGCAARTLAALESRGLIVATQRYTSDRLGVFRFKTYHVPIDVHFVWCQIAAEEFDALSDEEKAALEASE